MEALLDILTNILSQWIYVILAAIGGWVVSRLKSKRSERRKLEATEDGLKQLAQNYSLLPASFPYHIGTFFARTVIDAQGGGVFERRWMDVTPQEPIADLEIRYWETADAPGARLSRPRVESLRGELTLDLIWSPLEDASGVQSRVHTIRILGLVSPTQPVSFSITQAFSHLFCVTARAAKAAYAEDRWKKEYSGVALTAPTDLLRLEVCFPETHKDIRPEPVVFLTGTEIVLGSATEKIRGGFSFCEGKAVLEVEEPLHSLHYYAVSWMPPEV